MTELKNTLRDEENAKAAEAAKAEGFEPFGDRVLCRLESKETIKEGIIIPDEAQEKRQEATVVRVGPGRITEEGILIPMRVNIGDRVMLNRYGGTEVGVKGAKYQLVREDDILGRIPEDEETEKGE